MLNNKKSFRATWFVAFVMFLVAVPLLAQVAPTGTIFGVVKDASGASIPKANVTVQDTESGFARTGTTGDDGAYRFAALPVGHYTVKVVMTGFKTETQTGLTLDVAQEEGVNFTLQVGTTEQEVVVTGEASQVDTSTSSLGSLVSESQVSDLPLNGRNFVDLTLLQTGVVNFQFNTFAANNLFGEFYSSNGAPIRSNMYTLDGAIMGSIQGASASSISGNSLGIDGIREYKVMTNSFSAEYGLAMGSQMTIVSKGGSNQFHGDAFEYLRNSAFDARNYFDVLHTLPTTTPEGGKRIAPFRRNQFGGSLGGPVKKDKTFFFATYEGFRQLLDDPPALGITPTMPAACHVAPVNGVETVNSACDATLKGNATENIAPVMQPFVALWPNPNIEPGDQFAYLASQVNHENYVQGRVDHNISSSDTLFGRYTLDNDSEDYPYIFPYVASLFDERQQYVTIAENHIFSPTLLNSVRLSFSRAKQVVSNTQSASSPIPRSAATGPQYDFVTGVPCGSINISPLANFHSACASELPTGLIQNVFSLGDDVFWTKGKHAVKFGTLMNYYQQDNNPPALSAGSTAWASLHNFLLGLDRSYTVALPSNNPQKDSLFDTFGFYVQDDYRVLPRLTLNLGLRYEFATQENEKKGRQSYFANPPYSDSTTIGPLVEDPTYHNVSPRVGFAWDVFGDGKTSLRGGFAILYDIANMGGILGTSAPPFSNSFTVTNSTSSPGVLTLPLQIPAGAATSIQGSSPTTVQRNYTSPHMLDFDLVAERQLPYDMALSVAFAASRGLNLWQVSGDEQNPFCPTTNTFVPQGCPAGFTTVVPNAPPTWLCPNTAPAGSPSSCPAGFTSAPRLNPFFGNVNEFRAEGESWYNALEVNLKKRVGHGLEFQSAYTFSRALDDTEGLSNSDTSGSDTGIIENPFNNKSEWGPSNFDIKHNWHFNALYHFPTIKAHGFVDKIANGWWTGNIIAVETGLAFSPLLTSDRQQAGQAGSLGGWQRPDVVTAANLAAVTAAAVAAGVTTCPANNATCIPYNPVIFNPNTVYTHTVGQWFNQNMFAIQPVGTISNLGRNILRQPGLTNWDLSLNKDTHVGFLGEGGMLQFRAEMFNVLNHPNFGPGANALFSGSVKDNASFTPAQTLAAQGFSAENPSPTNVLATSNSSRQIQFSLKVVF